MKLKNKLEKINACREAVKWVGDKTLVEAWQTCSNGDWMLWLMQQGELCDLKTLTLAKARCAALAKPQMKDKRSIAALEAAFDFATGKITREELDIATYAAYAIAAYSVVNVTDYMVVHRKTLKQCADICREVLPNPKLK